MTRYRLAACVSYKQYEGMRNDSKRSKDYSRAK